MRFFAVLLTLERNVLSCSSSVDQNSGNGFFRSSSFFFDAEA